MGLKSKLGEIVLFRELSAFSKAALEGRKGERMQDLWSRFIKFMDGKKTYTGLALLAVPSIAGALTVMMPQAGFDLDTTTRVTAWVSGGLLTAVGLVHKVVKWADDQTPSQPPNRP